MVGNASIVVQSKDQPQNGFIWIVIREILTIKRTGNEVLCVGMCIAI